MATPPTRYQAYCVDHWGYQIAEQEKASLVLPLRFKPAVTLLLVGVALAGGWPWVLVIVGVTGLLGVAVPRLSWLDQTWNHGVRHLFRAPALGADPGPRRLACGLAELFVLGSGIGFLLGSPVTGWLLAGLVLLVAGVVVATGFCVAAWAYLVIARRLAERRPGSVAIALALLAAPSHVEAQTTGYLLPCSAASTLGRGCTLLAPGGDPATILVNPAGLRATRTRSIDLHGAAFAPSLSYSNALNQNASGQHKVYPLPALFLVDRDRGRLTLGVGAQPLGGMGAEYQLNHPLFRDPLSGAFIPQRYYSNLALLRAGVAAAFEPAPGFAFGVTAGVIYGRLGFTTPYSVDPSQLRGLAGLAADPDYAALLGGFTEATASAKLSNLAGFAASAGVSAQYSPSDRVAIAVAYTFPSTIPLGNGSATMDMSAQFGQLYQGMVQAKGGDSAAVNAQLAGLGLDLARGLVTNYRAEAEFGVPATLTIALLLRPTSRWSISADGGWIGYRSGFSDMPLRMDGGSNPNVNLLINGDSAGGGFRVAWPLDSKDSWVARLGTEYAATASLRVRGGVLYGSNPVPPHTLVTIFPAITEWTVSAGLSYLLGEVELHLAYAHAFAANAAGGTPHRVAQEYQGSRNRLTEQLLAAGLGWRF